ncbi:MAG: phosphofructokinase [Micrococcales bacterium]|nr:phosphofructokinase [Micrococcales bacterium]
MPTSRNPRVCVLAPTPILTVTLENGSDDVTPEIHVHPGGQGLWVARMAYSLGADVVVCGPFGGEAGTVLGHLAEVENLRVRRVSYAGGNGAYLHDRRGGERTELAFMPPARLDRHELDDLYGTVLVEALDADVCVVTGAYPTPLLPPSFFGRLVGDLRAAGVRTVADLSGKAAVAAAEAGADVLKMSHEELVEAGLAADDSVASLRAGARRLLRDVPAPPGGQGADGVPAGQVGAMLVSRAAEPALLVTAEGVAEIVPPSVTTVDHRGAGDSMTAGTAVGVGRGLRLTEAARLGAAAGALNVTRRGLGTGHREQIERFAEQITVREID